VLESERLRLRELEAGDLDDLAELFGDPEVTRYYQRPPEPRAWLDWNRGLYAERGFGLWAVILKETGELIGDCGLTPQVVEGVDEIEIGYHLKRAFWGRGLATEAARRCRDHAGDELALARLIAIIDPRNGPSQLVAKRIGLAFERRAVVFGRSQLIFATE
jgi:RimJ/RimL family protein N-acetyltransferase